MKEFRIYFDLENYITVQALDYDIFPPTGTVHFKKLGGDSIEEAVFSFAKIFAIRDMSKSDGEFKTSRGFEW